MKMKRLFGFIFIFVVIFFSFSCSNEQQNDDLSNGYKPESSMYLKADYIEKENEYLINIYYGHNYYNDNGKFTGGTKDTIYTIDICFVDENEKIIMDSYILKDYLEIDNDCVFNNKLDYKNCYGFRLNKKNLIKAGFIDIYLYSLKIDEQYNGIGYRFSYSKEEGIVVYRRKNLEN